MSVEQEKAIKEIKEFIDSYEDPNTPFVNAPVALAGIRDVVDKLDLGNSKDIGNAAVLGYLDRKQP